MTVQGGTTSCTYQMTPGYNSPAFSIYTQAWATCSLSSDASAANLGDGNGPSDSGMASMDSDDSAGSIADSDDAGASPSPDPNAPAQDDAAPANLQMWGGRRLLQL